ncbi:ankyrin repeat domain-containing protein, partial [Chlamydiia bacterium]|nr:ankyrin repeat domain-containing protein [Chlamydiia bacterium]
MKLSLSYFSKKNMFIQLRRFLATFIDLLLIQLIVSLMMGLDGVGYQWFGAYSTDSSFSVKYYFFILPIVPIFIINMILEISPLRASIGKLLLSIKSVRFDGTKASNTHMLIRTVVKYTFITLFYVLLSTFWSLNMFIIHDHFFVLSAIFFMGYGLTLIPHRMVREILQRLDLNVTTQSTLAVLSLPLTILRGVTYSILILGTPILFIMGTLFFSPNTKVELDIKDGVSFEEVTRQVDYWIDEGFDFNKSSSPLFVSTIIGVYTKLSEYFPIPLDQRLNQAQSTQTVFYAILSLDETTVKRYIDWIISHPDIEFDVFATVCFEQVYKNNAEIPLSWQHNDGEYIFNINQRYGDDQNTALHIAVLNNAESSVIYIINRSDLNPMLENKWGKTALDLATDNVNTTLIQLLGGTVSLEMKVFDLIRGRRFDYAFSILKNNPSLTIEQTDINDTNRTALMWALKSKDVPEGLIDLLYERGGDLDHTDVDGIGVLEHAFKNHDVYAMDKLVSKGVDINKPFSNGMSPLDNASVGYTPFLYYKSEKIQALFDKLGAQHSLHSAIAMKKEELIDELIQSGLDVNELKNDISPLILALNNDDIQTMRKLLDAGADVNVTASYGKPLINTAVIYFESDIVKLLLDYGSQTGASLYHESAYDEAVNLSLGAATRTPEQQKGLEEIIEMLNPTQNEDIFQLDYYINRNDLKGVKARVKAGDDINRSKDGSSIINLAIRRYLDTENQDLDVIKYLLNNGANANDVGEVYLSDLIVYGGYELFVLLVDNGLDVTHAVMGSSLIYIALNYNRFELVDLLMDREKTINVNDLFDLAEFYPKGLLKYIKTGHKLDPSLVNSDGETLIHSVVSSGSIELLEELTANIDIDWNQTNNSGVPLIFVSGTADMMRYLIQKGADPTVHDKFWGSLLHSAIADGFNGIIPELVSYEGILNTKNHKGQTPLVFALKYMPEAVKILLDAGADVTVADNEGKPPIFHVLSNKRSDQKTIERLISMGADIHWVDDDGNTLLHYNFNDQTLSILSSLGVDLNKPNNDLQTAFHYNLREYFKELHIFEAKIIDFLNLVAQFNLNVNTSDINGKTPLTDLIDIQLASACIYLFQIGAKRNVENGPEVDLKILNNGVVVSYVDNMGIKRDLFLNDKSTSLLQFVASLGDLQLVQETVSKYKNNGVSIDERDSIGYTALYTASIKGHSDVVKYLLDKGASPDIVDEDGRTALHIASVSGHLSVVEHLILSGASINAQTKDGRSALYVASSKGHLDIVTLLMDRGIPLDVVQENGWTALHIASTSGHLSVVEHLISSGASINAQTKNGRTPLYIASEFGHLDLVKLLLAKGASLDVVQENGWTAL